MTHVLITIDTELSAGHQARGMAVDDNYQSSFMGRVDGQSLGVPWLMQRMTERGIRGVFMVDPMPGLVHGPAIVERMVHPILEAGHDVQVHIHTEWLQWARESPVEGRQGKNIGDFSLADQISLIGWAKEALVRAGAPEPDAFRAGNFGANDDTLHALGALGIPWDSSYNIDYAGQTCRISLCDDPVRPVGAGPVTEVPVAALYDTPGHLRPAQICALSAREMQQALHHAAGNGHHSFVIVTHSFEMLSRNRRRLNGLVAARFLSACRAIAEHPAIRPALFADLAPLPAASPATETRLGPSRLRTLRRQAEQAWGMLRYERRG